MRKKRDELVKREDFLEGMSRVAQTVSVVTTNGLAGPAGVTISAMCSVSADPPIVLVCLHHESRTVPAVKQNRTFCVNVLTETMQNFATKFATITSTEHTFKTSEWGTAITGAPVLLGALVSFDCRIREIYRAGSHFIFIGDVEMVILRDGSPLIYGARSYGSPDYFKDD